MKTPKPRPIKTRLLRTSGPSPLAIAFLCASGLIMGGVAPLAGQVPGIPLGSGAETEELIDRVVAIAGDSVILLTQIREQIEPLVAQDASLRTDTQRLRELEAQIVENLIDQSLVVQAAIKDTTIVVDEARVEQIVDQDIAQRSQAMGGEAALMDGLRQQGWSMQQYRELLKQDARRQQLQQQYMLKQQRGMKPIPVTAEEVRTFYDENSAQFGSRPATVTFLQVVLQPKPSDSADAAALEEAERILTLALAGGDFAELARRNSDDPGSVQLGGDLGWFRRGSGFVREFEEAAFSIQSGQITTPVRTQYGYHIIKVERVRGPERKARHILIAFDIGQQELRDARALAENLKTQIAEGASPRALHKQHGGQELPDSLSVPMDQLSELPPGYAAVLRDAKPGSVFGPLEFGEGARANVTVGRVIEVRDEGTFTFTDLEPVIRDRLSREKILQELMKRLRDRAYVEVRP